MDPWIKAFRKRMKANKATQEEILTYAQRIGNHASAALALALRKENMPDGKIYYNIAKRLIEPILREVQELVNNAMTGIIEEMHKTRRIGTKVKKAAFNQDRSDAIINKIVAVSLEEEDDE